MAAREGENKTPVTILFGLFEFIAATFFLNLNTVLKLKCILLSLLIVLKLKRKSRKQNLQKWHDVVGKIIPREKGD